MTNDKTAGDGVPPAAAPNEAAPDAAPAADENRLIGERRAKLTAWRKRAVAFPNDFRRDALAAQLHTTYTDRDAAWFAAHPVHVRVGGRMMFKRVMGKASFAKIADRSGQIQLFLQEGTLGASYDEFKGFDVGDFLGAEGALFRTRTGELSVRVERLVLLTKSLRPLSDKWHGLADTELRYRQRYLDLVMNQASREVFRTRTRLLRYLRDYLDAADSGRCRRAAVQDASQCARPGYVSAYRPGAVPEASDRRWLRAGL